MLPKRVSPIQEMDDSTGWIGNPNGEIQPAEDIILQRFQSQNGKDQGKRRCKYEKKKHYALAHILFLSDD